jgi:GLPGLI family protein
MLPKTYITFKNMMLFDSFEFSGQKFLVEEELDKNWSITNEIKNISGYKCQKAILKDKENNKIIAEAWFTREIALPIGPSYYAGLPGLILKVVRFNKATGEEFESFVVEDIDLSPQKTIKLPKQKTITRDEFNETLNGTRARF